LPDAVRADLLAKQRLSADWIEKYGHVRQPIVAEFAGQTFVAVGPRLLYNNRWKTFHDFLFSYLGAVFEKDWFAAERQKSLEDRHPLLQWYELYRNFQVARHDQFAEGEVVKIDRPPAQISALLSFAYDLYTLEHHSLLQRHLIARLQRKEHFQGARYETYVAAAFVRAGFSVELEDESDKSDTHCEFSAIHIDSGKAYSIEAKSRHRAGYLGQLGKPAALTEIQADLSKLLVPALRKRAKHDRIVFIDVNVPPAEAPLMESDWFGKVAAQLKRLEEKPPPGAALPPAFVFLTNFPYHFVGEDEPLRGSAVVFRGLNMMEFRSGDPTAVAAAFPQIMSLYDSVLRHTQVPHDLLNQSD